MQSESGRILDLQNKPISASDAEYHIQVAGDHAGTTMDNLEVEDLDRHTHEGDNMLEDQAADVTGSSPTSPVMKKKSTTAKANGNPTVKKVLP
jgi:hypothetical protein